MVHGNKSFNVVGADNNATLPADFNDLGDLALNIPPVPEWERVRVAHPADDAQGLSVSFLESPEGQAGRGVNALDARESGFLEHINDRKAVWGQDIVVHDDMPDALAFPVREHHAVWLKK